MADSCPSSFSFTWLSFSHRLWNRTSEQTSRYDGTQQVYSSHATRQIFIVPCSWIHHSTSLYCQILPLTQGLLRIYSNKCATHVDFIDVCNSTQVAIIRLLKEKMLSCLSTLSLSIVPGPHSAQQNSVHVWKTQPCLTLFCFNKISQRKLCIRFLCLQLVYLIILWEQLPSVTFGVLRVVTVNVTVISDVSPCGRNIPTFRSKRLPPSNYTLKMNAACSLLFSGAWYHIFDRKVRLFP
jgi:hypothetical protein